MEVTLRFRAPRPAALLGCGLALLGACRGLPDVLPHAPEEEHELPAPEEVSPRRSRAAPALATFRLQNGMSVALLEDHALPEVVVDTWFARGSLEEGPGQRGFARLAEPLLSRRSPDHLAATDGARERWNELVAAVERSGGAFHVGADRDRTRTISTGPASLLPALLRLDAQRFAALHEPLAPSELERARAAVHGPVRAASPSCARAERLLAAALYPREHPYAGPTDLAGEDELRADLEAATPESVSAFLRRVFVAENATLVVAGAFAAGEVRALIEGTFGALPAGSARQHGAGAERRSVPPVRLEREERVVAHEPLELSRLVLAWPSPPEFAPGDAELDLLAILLAEGPASRLERRLVLDMRLAQEVDAGQRRGELGSVFVIEARGVPGADLEAAEREILAVVDELAREGPDAKELARARLRQEARFRRRMEGLLSRAEAIQAYRRAFGLSDGFRRDLERWTEATRDDLREVARRVLGPARVNLRILGLPAGEP